MNKLHRYLKLPLMLCAALTIWAIPAQAKPAEPVTEPVDLLVLTGAENPVAADCEVELAELENGHAIDVRAYDDFTQMLADCRAAGGNPLIRSSFRTWDLQEALFENRVGELCAIGYAEADARAVAATSVAPPGYSEHQLGLAVDIVEGVNFAENTAQVWLFAHCWEYGFILRYPYDKTEITGAIYEPWHYRYVGQESALAMRDSGLCLEEYLALDL